MSAPLLSLGALAALCAAFAVVYAAARWIDNYGIVDIAWSYGDLGLSKDPTADADRHREAFAGLEALGVTELFISAPGGNAAATLEFLGAFGQTYVQ